MSGFQDDWSAARRAAYERWSRGAVPAAIASLKLPGDGSGIPVFAGAEEPQLTLGAGHLRETSPIHGDGNTAIAGHRDGFFRSLDRLAVGDELRLEGAHASRTYRVTDLLIVEPRDVWVLEETPVPTLTLITCHPFYYVGRAPNRYVVRAEVIGEAISSTTESTTDTALR